MKRAIVNERSKRALQKIEPLAVVLLVPGSGFAVAADGELSSAGMKALFAVLFLLDLVMIHWLTRPKSV